MYICANLDNSVVEYCLSIRSAGINGVNTYNMQNLLGYLFEEIDDDALVRYQCSNSVEQTDNRAFSVQGRGIPCRRQERAGCLFKAFTHP
jgi:hypothetical protein